MLWQKKYGADRRITSAGKGGERAGQRKEKPCSSALSPCRCLETSLALRLTHLRLGSDLSPRMIAAGTFQRDRKKSFREEGGAGEEGPPFSKGTLASPAITGPATTAGPAKLVVQFQIGGGLRALFADADAVDAHMTGAFIGGQTAGHVLEDVAGDVFRRGIEAVEGRPALP